MRSRRSVICARRAALLARRSSRLSLGPANDFRRARASEEVIGAGATGPLRRAGARRVAGGGALGGVVSEPRDAASEAPPASAGVWPPAWPPTASTSFLRPSSFTFARLLRTGCCLVDGADPDLAGVQLSRAGPTLAEMSGSAADVG